MAQVDITLHVQAESLFAYQGGIKDGPVLNHCSISDNQGGGPEQLGCLFFFLPPHPVKDHTTHVSPGDIITWIPESLDPGYDVALLEINYVKTVKPRFWIAWILWFFFGLPSSKNIFKVPTIAPAPTDTNGRITNEIDSYSKIYDYEIRFSITHNDNTKEYTVHPRLKM